MLSIMLSEQVHNELYNFKIQHKYHSLHHALSALKEQGIPKTKESTKGLENIKWKTVGVPLELKKDLLELRDKAKFKSVNNLIHNLLKGAKKHEKRS